MIQTNNITPEEIAKSWQGKFHYIKGRKATDKEPELKGLRPPQIGALHAIMAHLEEGINEPGIVVMPTGTGKTETMLSFMIANQCCRTLVIVPSDALRKQISDKYKTLGKLYEIGVIESSTVCPRTTKIKGNKSFDEWKSIIEKNNVIVTTMASIYNIDEPSLRYIVTHIDYLIVDEAHHSQASTWLKFISHFPENKILLFTATPYRNDGKRLEGKIIFNYPLRKAQEDDYFKPIKFCPIIKYDNKAGDMAIAKKAVEILREDMAQGYEHILMARCKDHNRAEEVFKIYQKYNDLNPVVIHSKTKDKKKILSDIKALKHKIIVCVNMLGEGYDLPNLKIAAVHDDRQSLPITLQFIGRFTRTSPNLDQASFVTNLANAPIREEIISLYQQDADWNKLLPRISDDKTMIEQKANEFMLEFKGSLTDEISIDDIHPALSAEIYQCNSYNSNIFNWKEGLKNLSKYQFQKWAYTNDMIVIVLGHTSHVEWGDISNVENLSWDLIVIYHDVRRKRIYLNSTLSLKGETFLKPIFGEVNKISGDKTFRSFADVKRLFLNNVGTRLPHGRDISFQQFFGSSVEDGLDNLTKGKLKKNNLYGIGFRDGKKISIGCSVRGKIWSRERGNLYVFKEWCDEIGNLIFNENIDTDIVLKNTLRFIVIKNYPDVAPIGFDWPDEVYEKGNLAFNYGKHFIKYDEFSVSIDIEKSNNKYIYINFESEIITIQTRCFITGNKVNYELLSPNDKPIFLTMGQVTNSIDDYFNEFYPRIFFADGSVSYGSHLVESISSNPKFDASELIPLTWDNTDLSKESIISKGEFRKNSIQYVFYEYINDCHDIIINDDGSGEIADLIGINNNESSIELTLYHLKYAIDGKVSKNINNLYQVCGQAIKSIRWKYALSKKLFDSILKRDERKTQNNNPSSFLKGKLEQLLQLKGEALNSKELKFHIAIVQPGLSRKDTSEEILILLGNVRQYLKDCSGIDLKVFCSE